MVRALVAAELQRPLVVPPCLGERVERTGLARGAQAPLGRPAGHPGGLPVDAHGHRRDDVVRRATGQRVGRPLVQEPPLDRQQLGQHRLAHQAVPERVVGALHHEHAHVDGLADRGRIALGGSTDAECRSASATQSPNTAARRTSSSRPVPARGRGRGARP